MHAVASWFVYNILYWLFFHTYPSSFGCFLAFFFGTFPDLDGIYFSIKNKKATRGTEFQHHLNSWFHWPIYWIPLIILFILSLIFKFYPEYFITPMLGIYLHMVLDSIACGDGMMWGHGFRKKNFSRYINLCSSKTDGYHGNYWGAKYRQTIFYKIENILAMVLIFISIYYMWIQHRFIFLHFLNILFTIFYIITTIISTGGKYQLEPPEGRYADYRKNPEYLEWMKQKGYVFDKNYKPIKLKKQDIKN